MKTLNTAAYRITRLIFLAFVLSACVSTALREIPSEGAEVTATKSGFIAPARSATPDFSPSLQASASSPTASVALPAVTPTLEPQLPSAEPPVVSAEVTLSPENASRVTELAGWGQGYAFNVGTGQLVANGKILVQKEIVDNLPTFSGGTVRTRFWGVPSGDLRLELIHPDGYDTLFVSPSGTRFAIFQNYCHRENPKPCLLEIRSLPANELLQSIDPGFINTAIFSPDGRLMALSTENDIAIWDLDAAKLVQTLPNSFRFDLLEFSHDGKLLVGCQYMGDGTVRVWRAATGELLASLSSRVLSGGYSPNVIAFSQDDAQLAFVYGGSVELWRVSDWSEGSAWTWYDRSGITRISFSPDGRLIASGATDGQITLADALTGKVLKSWDIHSDETYDYISDLSFAADGKLLVSISMDHTVRFWGIRP